MVLPWVFFTYVRVLCKRMSWIFLNTHQHSMFERSMNASFLTLILKKCNAVNIICFLPISLVYTSDCPKCWLTD